MQAQSTSSLRLSSPSSTPRLPPPTLCPSIARGNLRLAPPLLTPFSPRRRKRRKGKPNPRRLGNIADPAMEGSRPNRYHPLPPGARLPHRRLPQDPRRRSPPHQQRRRGHTSIDQRRPLPLLVVWVIRPPRRKRGKRKEKALSRGSKSCSPPRSIRNTRGKRLMVTSKLSFQGEECHTPSVFPCVPKFLSSFYLPPSCCCRLCSPYVSYLPP